VKRSADSSRLAEHAGQHAAKLLRQGQVWRLADGTPAGEPLRGQDADAVSAVATGALPDGAPVIVTSGGIDGMVRVWRLADRTQLMPPLGQAESVRAIAVHGNVVVTAPGADVAVHQPAPTQPMR